MPDEHRDEKIVEGCEVYAQAKERAKGGERTISMDELTGVQAIERKHPDLPMQPGYVLRREFAYIRHGTLSWFLNLEVVTGHIIEPSWGPTRTEEDALAHLQRLIASDQRATKWHILVDNLNIHQSESLVRWVAEREGIAAETLGIKGKSGILHSMESRAAFLHDPTHQSEPRRHALVHRTLQLSVQAPLGHRTSNRANPPGQSRGRMPIIARCLDQALPTAAFARPDTSERRVKGNLDLILQLQVGLRQESRQSQQVCDGERFGCCRYLGTG